MHFLWLACVPAAIFFLGLRFAGLKSPEAKYGWSILALASMLPMFAVALWLAEPAQATSQARIAPAITLGSGLGSGSYSQSLRVENTPGGGEVGPITSGNVAPPDSATREIGAKTALTLSSESDSWIGGNDSWARYVTMAYMVGVTLFTLRLLRGYWQSRRLRQGASRVTDPDVQRLADRIAKQFTLRKTPLVLWCDQTMVPTVVGVFRPAVLLPVALANGVSIEQIEHVLLHEFTHLRRHDALVNFLQSIVETLFFFHPLVWWISRQVRLNRELSCDASVVSCGIDPKRYAGTLIEVATRGRAALTRNHSAVSTAVPSVSSRSQLRIRLERLIDCSTTKPSHGARLAEGASLLVLLAVVCAFFLTTLTVSLAAPQTQDSPPPTLDDDVQKMMPQNIDPLELAGVVIDAEGSPLAGVTVDAWSWHPGDETTTDENGVFRFRPDSDNGRSKVEVRWMKPGYSPHYVAQQPVGVDGLIVTLDSTTYIEGTVTAADGSPAADVTVRGTQKNIQGDGVQITEVATETKTDQFGKYRLYVFPDDYEITVADAVGVARTNTLQLSHGQALEKSIQLEPGVRFEALVKDANSGEPFAGLVLWSFAQKQFRGTSDAQGRLVIDGMLPGEFQFSVGAGDPIEYRGMKFHRNGPLGRWWSPDAKHEWQRHDVKPGTFQRNFDGLAFDLTPGMKPVQIVVEQGVEFSGHVYDPNGNPRSGATVAPAKTGSGNSLTGDTRYSAKTAEDGSYNVVMPAGNEFHYNLMAFDGEYSQWRKWGAVARDPLPTQPGLKMDGYDFTLTRGATVRGKVASLEEDAPPRQVRAHPADLRGNRYYDPTVDVQADGTFELRGLRPGKHYIQVSPFWLAAEDAENGASVIIEVTDGDVREGIQLRAPEPKEVQFNPAAKPQQPVDIPATTEMIAAGAGGVIFTTEDKIFSTPCFDETSMYFGACDGNFYCLDKLTGKLQWKVDHLERVDANPVLYDGKVFFTSFKKKQTWFHAVEAKSGKLVWEKQLPGCGNSHPLIHDGKVLVAGTTQLVSFDPKNGRETFAYPIDRDGGVINAAVATRGSKILVLVTTDYEANDDTGSGRLICFDTGVQTPTWTLPLGGCSFGNLQCDKRRCYFGTRDGRLNAVELASGKLAWAFDCADVFVDREQVWPNNVIDNGDSLVVTCTHQSLNDPGAMICVDKTTGVKRWSLINSLGFSNSSGVTTDSIVTAGLDHRLMRIDPASGTVQFIGILPKPDRRWQAEFYSVVADDGFAFIVDAEKQVWRFDLGKLN
ncbi:PQQ-binding-like beta-propeller repeat protein [Stieleria sp. ICT_E10.1]|uniref:M56 family metallopeptidase n=1 Tax=Stieleria sedimenti TaxID=2976331 RepID=UPI00217F5AD5|nr:M56 family metallopeptidase [Stieleria sedimenti]MCS7469686.1 PQQ-binding-like beta-propeller repeat protein [Stieleria sedimenti]